MHVQHDTTGKWQFDVGAGFANPPWVPDQAGGVLALNKVRRKAQVDARTQELIAVGFTHSSKQFSLSIPAQINWLGAGLSASSLTYPYRVGTIDDLDFHDFADAAEMLTAYGIALGVKAAHLTAGSDLKKQLNDAVDQTAVDAVVDSR